MSHISSSAGNRDLFFSEGTHREVDRRYFVSAQIDHSDRRNRSDPSRKRPEPVGSVMFRYVPCNRIPAVFSPDKFRRLSSRNALERIGTERNSSGEKTAGIRLQGK